MAHNSLFLLAYRMIKIFGVDLLNNKGILILKKVSNTIYNGNIMLQNECQFDILLLDYHILALLKV